MRNLKRVLSLALALVMVLGMMVITTSAATYADADEITYEEAIAVLSGVGLYQGDDKGNVNPTDVLTRKEAAVLITRIMLGDKMAASLSPTEQIYSDVPLNANTEWYAAAVEYCSNIGMIAGYNGEFNPDGKLTGVAFAKLLLCALGYDAVAEGYEGDKWAENIKADALAENLYIEDVKITDELTREGAAQMILQVLDQNMVKYVTSYDYATGASVVTGPWDQIELFRTKYFPTLVKDTTDGNDGVWGRPYDYQWVYGKSVLWTEWEEADAIYYAPVTECDIASDIKMKTASKKFDVYTNGVLAADKEEVVAIATTTKLNEQGRIMEVYDDEIVYIDTYLAQVTDVKAATFDAAGHLKTSSSMTLKVWTSTTPETVTLYGGKVNFEYSKFAMLLVNAVDNALGSIAIELTANGYTPEYLDIVQAPTAEVGTQTVLWYNVKQHTVNGVTYNDAVQFHLNQAGQEIGAHTWYFDQFGNLIGAVDIKDQYTYGVISNLWWSGDAATGTGSAIANIVYMDGTTTQVKLASVDMDGVAGTDADKVYTPVYDAGYTVVNNQLVAQGQPMSMSDKYLYVSSNAYTNLVADTTNNIIADNLFQFVTLNDGSVVAYLVTDESKNATIKTGYSLVDGDKDFYTNSDTVYLVRTEVAPNTYTYASIADYNAIGNYTGVTADWVSTDTDIYAEYVYFYGTANDDAAEFVYSNGNNYSAVLKTRGDGVYYYEFTYGVGTDGTTATIPVAVADVNQNNVNDVIEDLIGGVGKLFKIEYTNGLAVKATEVDADGEAVYSNTAKYLGNRVTANGNVLYVNGVGAYNITTSTIVIGGTLADLAVEGKGVYVIYNTNASNFVSHIYITNYGPSANAGLTSVAVKGVAAALQLDGTYAVTITAADAKDTTTEFVKIVTATGASVEKVEYSTNGTTWNNWTQYNQKSDVTNNPHLLTDKLQVRITVKAANGATAQHIVKVTYNENVVSGIAQVPVTKKSWADTSAANAVLLKEMTAGVYMFEELPVLDPIAGYSAPANEFLFFIYNNAKAGDSVTLTIYDDEGTLVYLENTTDASGNSGVFFMQYANVTSSHGTYANWVSTQKGLTTGAYNWFIKTETAILTSGTITVA